MSTPARVLLCPGQGAQSVGMGKAWIADHPASAQTFAAADETIRLEIDGETVRLSDACFDGPAERLNRTDVSQPALYTCSVASYQGLLEEQADDPARIVAIAGLSLGEWTALHLAGAFGFLDGLRLVALRGRLMQEAAESSRGGMVALIGADEEQAQTLCDDAARGEVLVPANYNAPGQIVVSGAATACDRALQVAGEMGLRATRLAVAGAFHSPLMEPAAEGLSKALEEVEFQPLTVDVWSNVTARAHHHDDPQLLKERLVQQLTSPVRWSQSCTDLIRAQSERSEGDDAPEFHELAPGAVLKGLMRRIDRACTVETHDEP